MGALWDMLTCRQIHGFLERVRTRLSKCNHPGQKTFLVSLRLFLNSLFLIMQPGWERWAWVLWKPAQAVLGRYLQSCCSLAGIVHLDLLNCGEAVDRLNDCLVASAFPYIHFSQHGLAAVTGRAIPWLHPGQRPAGSNDPGSSFILLFLTEMIRIFKKIWILCLSLFYPSQIH